MAKRGEEKHDCKGDVNNKCRKRFKMALSEESGALRNAARVRRECERKGIVRGQYVSV